MTADDATRPRPVVLCVLDGWGHRIEARDNAIAAAETPVWDALMRDCPHALIEASSSEVGLPQGQMGNSEVGHMNLGAGRVVAQDMPRIDAAIADGTLATNPALEGFVAALKASGGTCHLLGLISPGGVHSHQGEIAALARIIGGQGVPIAVHGFLDGRDTPPQSAKDYMARFMADAADIPGLALATIAGRYYAMDRDTRWDRTELAYGAIVDGKGPGATDAMAAIEGAYGAGITDEFVIPAPLGDYGGANDADGILVANFRADRVRQLASALLDPGFDGFRRARTVKFAAAAGLAQYSTALDNFMATLFPRQTLDDVLGQVVARAGMAQLRIAETEKYAHVTFFFNGGEEQKFAGEERILVPSPKVATYDETPAMSAEPVTDKLVAAIAAGTFDFILVNYANADMVGHTGDLGATIRAVETVDRCLGRLRDAVGKAGGALVITADHGNAELMRGRGEAQPHTAHTTNLVPLVLVNGPAEFAAVEDGRLCDIAPTVLELLSLPQPGAMTGQSLLVKAGERRGGAEQHASA